MWGWRVGGVRSGFGRRCGGRDGAWRSGFGQRLEARMGLGGVALVGGTRQGWGCRTVAYIKCVPLFESSGLGFTLRFVSKVGGVGLWLKTGGNGKG